MADNAETILKRLLGNVDDRYDKTPGSFFYDTQKPFALEAEKLYVRMETIADRAFVSTATGSDLDEKVMEAGLTRLPPTAASGTVTISGVEGTRITAGIKVKSDELLFTIPESVTSISADAFSDTVLWMVYENSVAHATAEENNVEFFVIHEGDAPEFVLLNGVTYYLNGEEAITVKADASLTELIIPATVQGLPVLEIKSYLCEEHRNLRRVVLPEGLKKIGKNAFNCCVNLEQCTIPSTVEEIDDEAFRDCLALDTALPASLKTLGRYAFSETAVTSVTIPQGLRTIKEGSFSGCQSLASIFIPDMVNDIGESAFQACTNLQSVL